jgi:omega-6 fatty acid desaturase (delta-12 desaturase)
MLLSSTGRAPNPLPCHAHSAAPPPPAGNDDERRAIMAQVAPFQAPQPARSVLQAVSTFLMFFAVIGLMYAVYGISVWLALAMAPVAAGLMVRIFIIQHDCGHASLFRSRWLNDWLGRMCSLITLTPYSYWRRQHAIHHAVWNNLDARAQAADIYSSCLTLAEYNALSPFRRLVRRVSLHPVVAFVLVPPVLFLLLYRLPLEIPASWHRERISVWLTNAALAAAAAVAMWCFGIVPVLLVHLPVILIASIIGVWLFSIQHRFESARWLHREAWNPVTAATEGCSYLKLPRVLQWFTGSIGYHHIHHLAPRVPNYRLQACHEAAPGLALRARTLTLWQALCAFRFTLWDEQSGRMVDFPAPRPTAMDTVTQP